MSPNNDVSSLARKMEAALSRDRVSFGELFTDEFMREHTSYPTFIAMSEASGARTVEELLAIPPDAWNRHVIAGTSFSSWEEMQQEAFAQWLRRQVDET